MFTPQPFLLLSIYAGTNSFYHRPQDMDNCSRWHTTMGAEQVMCCAPVMSAMAVGTKSCSLMSSISAVTTLAASSICFDTVQHGKYSILCAPHEVLCCRKTSLECCKSRNLTQWVAFCLERCVLCVLIPCCGLSKMASPRRWRSSLHCIILRNIYHLSK